MNHYEVLGVERGADAAALKRAYLAAARRHHPDFHVDADAATRKRNASRMQAINEAWSVLGDAAARAAYDRDLTRAEDPGVARRAAREQQQGRRDPAMPSGKGWTPRAGDDGWMTDFRSWADDADDLPPDREPTNAQRIVTVLPVALFVGAVLSLFLGLAFGGRAFVALGFVAIIISAGLFLLLPMFEMSRGRRRP